MVSIQTLKSGFKMSLKNLFGKQQDVNSSYWVRNCSSLFKFLPFLAGFSLWIHKKKQVYSLYYIKCWSKWGNANLWESKQKVNPATFHSLKCFLFPIFFCCTTQSSKQKSLIIDGKLNDLKWNLIMLTTNSTSFERSSKAM